MLQGALEVEGLMSAEAMMNVVRQAMKDRKPPQEYLETIWDTYDADKSGTLDPNEVAKLMVDLANFTQVQ